MIRPPGARGRHLPGAGPPWRAPWSARLVAARHGEIGVLAARAERPVTRIQLAAARA